MNLSFCCFEIIRNVSISPIRFSYFFSSIVTVYSSVVGLFVTRRYTRWHRPVFPSHFHWPVTSCNIRDQLAVTVWYVRTVSCPCQVKEKNKHYWIYFFSAVTGGHRLLPASNVTGWCYCFATFGNFVVVSCNRHAICVRHQTYDIVSAVTHNYSALSHLIFICEYDYDYGVRLRCPFAQLLPKRNKKNWPMFARPLYQRTQRVSQRVSFSVSIVVLPI